MSLLVGLHLALIYHLLPCPVCFHGDDVAPIWWNLARDSQFLHLVFLALGVVPVVVGLFGGLRFFCGVLVLLAQAFGGGFIDQFSLFGFPREVAALEIKLLLLAKDGFGWRMLIHLRDRMLDGGVV